MMWPTSSEAVSKALLDTVPNTIPHGLPQHRQLVVDLLDLVLQLDLHLCLSNLSARLSIHELKDAVVKVCSVTVEVAALVHEEDVDDVGLAIAVDVELVQNAKDYEVD